MLRFQLKLNNDTQNRVFENHLRKGAFTEKNLLKIKHCNGTPNAYFPLSLLKVL